MISFYLKEKPENSQPVRVTQGRREIAILGVEAHDVHLQHNHTRRLAYGTLNRNVISQNNIVTYKPTVL